MRRFAIALALVSILGGCGDESSGGVESTLVPATSQPVTTEPVTTGPVSTGPVTTQPATTSPVREQACPEVTAIELNETGPGVFTVSATVRSEDIPDGSYADAWEVRDLNGNVLGTRELTHPHVNEQPFTRSLSNVDIPTDVTMIEVDARDSARGFCGTSKTVEVPHS